MEKVMFDMLRLPTPGATHKRVHEEWLDCLTKIRLYTWHMGFCWKQLLSKGATIPLKSHVPTLGSNAHFAGLHKA